MGCIKGNILEVIFQTIFAIMQCLCETRLNAALTALRFDCSNILGYIEAIEHIVSNHKFGKSYLYKSLMIMLNMAQTICL